MDEANLLVFVDEDQRFEVVITPPAIAAMLNAAALAGAKETGGILIGRHQDNGATAIVLEATAKTSDSRFGWSWFQRGVSGLKSLLAQRWKDGRHYLGEWHYHPGQSPLPSHADRLAIADIAGDARYHCPEPVLAIVGGTLAKRELFVGVGPCGESLRTLRRLPMSTG